MTERMNVDMALGIATRDKPEMGEPCNNCGWCCLTEVCPVGLDLGGGTEAPCKLLVSKNGKHYCSLADNETLREILDIGGGCDAQTQTEQIMRLMG